MGSLVVLGAKTKCPQGSAEVPLVPDAMEVVMGDGPVATIMDFKPMKNIMPMGTCKILTAAASGVSTPCVPAVVAPWTPGAKVVKIGMFPALSEDSKAICSIGGTVEISDPGQSSVDITIE
jgi:hypothetical protein